jgi:glycosyltransferase involved in cell wall biosynthesis
MLTADRRIDRRILLEADSLEAAGWKVTIVAAPPDNDSGDDDARIVRLGSGHALAKRERLILHAYRLVRQYVPMDGPLMRFLKRLTWSYFEDQEAFFIKLFSDVAFRYSPTVFVAHDLPVLAVARLAARQCGAKLLYDSHELYSEQMFSTREKSRWAEIEEKHIGACDAVITVNQSIATELERRYGIRGVRVIYNAERSADAPPKTRLFHQLFGLAADKKVLLLQGGISSGRNLEVLVDAMRHVQNASIVLVILGEGVLLKKLQAKAKSGELAGRVHFHPAVPQKELLAFTAAADAGIIPYQAICLNNYYCTPNKLFEFIAAGIPILASDLPEIRSMVQGQQIGLVGDMSTPEKLAVLVDEFFSDEQQLALWRANIAQAGKRICWEEEEKKLVEIYEALR